MDTEYDVFIDPETGQPVQLLRERPEVPERTFNLERRVDEAREDVVAELLARMGIASLSDVRAETAACGPRRWLLEGVWISNTPAIIGGEEKVGKTTILLDLLISIASGTPFLGAIIVALSGPVVGFFAEDDAAEVVRRINAICADRGLDPDTLPIRLCFSPPNISNDVALSAVARELADHPAVAMVLDPLYLSIGEKGDGANLYAMGSVLRAIGEVCRRAGTALMIAHHWNKGGTGTGRQRLSGTGTTQWARSIISVSTSSSFIETVEDDYDDRQVTQYRKTANLLLDVSGNSVVDQELTVRRLMYATDPVDLDSPLIYHVERVHLLDADAGSVESQPLDKVGRAYRAAVALGAWFLPIEAQKWDALRLPVKRDGTEAPPLKADTMRLGLVACVNDGRLLARVVDKRGTMEFALPGTPMDAVREEVPF
jgi:hypothetical protein